MRDEIVIKRRNGIIMKEARNEESTKEQLHYIKKVMQF
jgi:hypothetical protein